MKIVIACDHRGYEQKRRLIPMLKDLGHDVADMGCNSSTSVDYPDLAAPAAQAVALGEADLGVLLDNSGIGMSIVANKVPGCRAALVLDDVAAKLAREANHCNVLCLATDLLSEMQMDRIVKIFLKTELGGGRHERRVKKVIELDKQLRGAK
ncbi:MAG: RpiB/LacA/LacB family sugar-phosphate isomerase [Tepidisphaeraceae bacterium]